MTKRKKKAGRPPEATDGIARTLRSVRFSDAEWAVVQRLAKLARMTTSAWIRARAMNRRTR